MYFFLCFCVLVIVGGTEGQNCVFPCYWHNKDFTMLYQGSLAGSWNFSASGTTSLLQFGSETRAMDCFQIVGHFVIAIDEDKDKITCLAVEVDNPDCFTAIVGDTLSIAEFTDICSVCGGNVGLFKLSEREESVPVYGYINQREADSFCVIHSYSTASNPAQVDCVIPVGCPAKDGEISCTDNGSIDMGNCSGPPKRCRQRNSTT